MDRFMEQVVVKHNRGLNEVLYVLSMVMMIFFGLIALMGLNLIFMAFSVGLLI